MILIARLEKLLTPILAHQNLDLVRIQFLGQSRPTLEIMIDRLDGTAVTIEDCTHASRNISAILDVEDPVEGSYKLEVTSPGLDRPLMKARDFQRFVGRKIKFQIHQAKEGRKKFTGVLEKADEQSIQVHLDEKETESMEVLYSDIQQAKLVPEF